MFTRHENTWVHVAVTASTAIGSVNDRTFRIYIDGIETASVNTPDSSLYPTNTEGYIGGGAFGFNDNDYTLLRTAVDQVRIYDRALSASDITRLANPAYE